MMNDRTRTHFMAVSLMFTLFLPMGSALAQNLKWCNFNWQIRDDTGGPGPNTFSRENVRVADDGTLHVQIVQRDNRWTCAELNTTESFGYGTYEFSILSRVDQLDRNVVLGLFSYPNEDVGPDGTNELDIEFARWGDAKNPNGNYTVWPVQLKHDNASSVFEIKLKEPESKHLYTWTPESVLFESLGGFSGKSADSINKWTTPASFAKLVSHSPMPVHINLWLFNSKPPADGKPVEIVIKAFTFKKAR
jgi:hypothetical protein